ncbi:MAG: GGDEF domain-containing protein, partial [Arcobacter skirrowii]|nr:GGDEF domain-containing protein [Aliarcobacter skirrowii]
MKYLPKLIDIATKAVTTVDDTQIINDTYGHLAGDMVLKKIADVVKNTIRSTDLACRWGGEEFFIIYPST